MPPQVEAQQQDVRKTATRAMLAGLLVHKCHKGPNHTHGRRSAHKS